MDVESLIVSPGEGLPSPAATLLEYATRAEHWPGECVAGEACPFCQPELASPRGNPLCTLRVLRWYELASGKRWSFRDLFSLVSYLLAGNRPTKEDQHGSPCQWAAHLIELDKAGTQSSNPRRQHLTAAFHLVTSSYQHALFHRWDSRAVGTIRQGLKDLGLDKDTAEVRVLLGLQHFLQERKDTYLPAAIGSLLESLVDFLDPAMASPDIEVAVSGRSRCCSANWTQGSAAPSQEESNLSVGTKCCQSSNSNCCGGWAMQMSCSPRLIRAGAIPRRLAGSNGSSAISLVGWSGAVSVHARQSSRTFSVGSLPANRGRR